MVQNIINLIGGFILPQYLQLLYTHSAKLPFLGVSMLDGFTLLIAIFLFIFTNFGKPRPTRSQSEDRSHLSGSIESDREELAPGGTAEKVEPKLI